MNVKSGASMLSHLVAATGENMAFVAFMAHSWAAFGILTLLVHAAAAAHVPPHVAVWCAAVAAVALAAWKEFWFDLRYEQDPPQTVEDSTLDFIGYLAGVALAVLVWGL